MIRPLLALALPAAPGIAHAADRSFMVGSFTRVRVDGPFAVTIATGKSPGAKATGSNDALDALTVRVDGDTAVVVEVRKRRSTSHGHPLETIDPFKRQRISLCAQLWWIRQGQRQYKHLRFDVVSILNEAQPQWIRNAWLLTLCKP